MGYAQYLWVTDKRSLSVRMTAVVYHQRDLGSAIDRRFLFAPHIYRVQQHIGEAAWIAAQQEVAHLALGQVFADTCSNLNN